jgi:hypothetical protein
MGPSAALRRRGRGDLGLRSHVTTLVREAFHAEVGCIRTKVDGCRSVGYRDG